MPHLNLAIHKGDNVMDAQTEQLVHFLQEELHISADRTHQVLAECPNPRRLPVILWQNKLVTLGQLDGVLAWFAVYVGRLPNRVA